MRFSVIIPSYNNPEELSEMLESIRKQCIAIVEHEVIVVDDGSRDNRIEMVCHEFPFVTYLRCEKNGGVAAARNAGAALAHNDILVFIDSDVLIESDFITALTRQFLNAEVIAVSCTKPMTPANPNPYTNYWSIYKEFHMPKGPFTTLFTGVGGAIRKEYFEKAGKWDSKMRGSLKEEYEFTQRFERLGCKINYEPGFVIRPRYNGFWKMAPENFRRTKKWCIIFLSRRKFDDYTSTLSGGMSFLLGALTILSGIITFFLPIMLYGLTFVFGLYMIYTTRFWIYIYKRKKSFASVLVCFIFHLMKSLFIFFGALYGFAYIFASEKRRRHAISN